MEPLNSKNWLSSFVKNEENFSIKFAMDEVAKELSFLKNVIDYKIADAWRNLFVEYFKESQKESEKSVINAFSYFKDVSLTFEDDWEITIHFMEIPESQQHLIEKEDVLNIVVQALNHWMEECFHEKKLINKKIGSGRVFTDSFMMKKDMGHTVTSKKHQLKKF